MEYNKKEQLFDKITGLMINDPCLKENWINEGISEVFKRTENFFNNELVPEVPQFIADWYEKHKDDFEFSVFNYLYTLDGQECSVFKKWLVDSKTEPFKVLVNMHQFGYKIKKDKKYLVKLIQGGQYLHTDQSGETYFTAFSHSSYTKDKLEELDLEWVFDCPGIKLEEVE